MAYEVQLTSAAEQDIEDALRYFAEEAPHISRFFLDAVENSLGLIGGYPEVGRSLQNGFRQMLVTRFNYLIYYRIGKNTVVVLGVLHGARNPKVKDTRLQ